MKQIFSSPLGARRAALTAASLALCLLLLTALLRSAAAESGGSVEIAGMTAPLDATTLDLSGRAVEKPALMRALGRLTMLTQVNLLDTGLDARDIEALMERYPAISFRTDIGLMGGRYTSEETALDFSGRSDLDIDRLYDALRFFPALEEVDLTGCGVPDEWKFRLAADYPDVFFLWELELLDGLTVSSDVESLDLTEYTVNDLADFRARLALLKRLGYADMCGCGLTDAEMAGLRTDFPDVKFVWIVHVGAWDLRTDAKGFSMGLRRDFSGVYFVGENYSCYRSVTKETIAPLQYCTELEALDVGHSYGLTDISVVQYMPNLRFLIITDTNVADIEPVGTLRNLEFFEMFLTRDKENRRLRFADITPVLGIKSLKQYNCSQIPNADIEVLKQLTWLERLWVIKCGFSEEQLQELQTALPDTWILAVGKQGGTNWRYRNPMYFELQDLCGLPYSWQTPD